MTAGTAALIVEPVPLFDRAVSKTLDCLAEQKAKPAPGAADASHAIQGGRQPRLVAV